MHRRRKILLLINDDAISDFAARVKPKAVKERVGARFMATVP